MFRKLNIWTLLVVFLVLGGIILITRLIKNDDRTFRDRLLSISADEITEIIYQPDPKKAEEVRLVKDSQGIWRVVAGKESFTADTAMIHNMIRSLAVLKPEQVVATEEAKWPEFQVDDSTGIRIRMLEGQEVVADLIVGKFSYKPQQGQTMYGQDRGKMSSYVRLSGEKDVYAVEGFLRMTFQSNGASLRDKKLVKTRREDITKVIFSYPGNQTFVLERQGDRFTMDGLVTDSAETIRYLTDLARLSSQDFVLDVAVGNTPDYKVRIESNNIVPIEINAFPADTVNKFYLTSTANPGAVFSGYGKNKLFERVFISREKFFPAEKGLMKVY
jgi:hypothetical protein